MSTPHSSPPRDSTDDDPPADRIRHMHDVLSDPHRCAVLHYLQEFDDPADVRELAERVRAWCGDERGATDGEDRAWLLKHVLAMDEFGLVAYDPERDTVELSEDVTVAITTPLER